MWTAEQTAPADRLRWLLSADVRRPLGDHIDMFLDFVVHGEHRRLLAEEIARYEQDPEVLGLMLQGSVARGEASPRSDLDLFALLRDGCSRPFRHVIRQGILVECHFADATSARRKLAERPALAYGFLEGKLLFGRADSFDAVIAHAKEVLRTYVVTDQQRQSLHHWLTSAKLKIRAALGEGTEREAAYLAAVTSWQIISGIWMVNGQPVPPVGSALRHLSKLSIRPPDLEATLDRLFLVEHPTSTQAALELLTWLSETLSREAV